MKLNLKNIDFDAVITSPIVLWIVSTRHRAAGIQVVSGWKAKLKALGGLFWVTKRDTDQTGGLVK